MNDSAFAHMQLYLAQEGGGAAAPPPGGTVQPGAPGSPAGGGNAPPPSGGMGTWILILPIALLLLMMIFSGSSQKKEKRRRAEMLGALAKHDKVQTVGGVIGTVVEVKDGEIILKVDEATNTRMRFAKSAVQRVLKDNTPAEVT